LCAELPTVHPVISTRESVLEHLKKAHLVIGAVLINGAKAPKLILKDDLKVMMPGSAIVDVAVDQGGIAETSRPTTHEKPTYVVDNVVHYCVANMPGAFPQTSTLALTNATFPYVETLAEHGWKTALKSVAGLREGLNVCNGHVTHPAVANAFGLEYVPPETFLK
jgi:alanine dehydrogenase